MTCAVFMRPDSCDQSRSEASRPPAPPPTRGLRDEPPRGCEWSWPPRVPVADRADCAENRTAPDGGHRGPQTPPPTRGLRDEPPRGCECSGPPRVPVADRADCAENRTAPDGGHRGPSTLQTPGGG